jgi:hypothetical protein
MRFSTSVQNLGGRACIGSQLAFDSINGYSSPGRWCGRVPRAARSLRVSSNTSNQDLNLNLNNQTSF